MIETILIAAALSPACGWIIPCEVAHPIGSHLPIPHRCHSTKCRVKPNNGSGNDGQYSSREPGARKKADYWCVKSWTYKSHPYWHWRHYKYGRMIYTGRDHTGYTTQRPRCVT